MSARPSFAARLYARLLKALVPSVDREYADEAVATFRQLEADARSQGLPAHLCFLGRELRALLGTARREDRGRVGREAGLPQALRQDLRWAVGSLSRSPGFVGITVLSLSLAIAVATGVFSAVNAALLRPVPHVADQDELVAIFAGTSRRGRLPHSFPDFLDYRELSGTLQDVAAIGSRNFAVGPVAGGTRQLWGLAVSTNYFQLLGIPLARGRGFLPEDVDAGGRVVVIGHNTWQREFDGAPDVLGRDLYLNGHPYTVVGVGPEGMVELFGPRLLEIVVPLVDYRDARGRLWLSVVGRREPGVATDRVQTEFDGIARRLTEVHPNDWDPQGGNPRKLRVLDLREARFPEEVPLGAILGGVGGLVGILMLIACSNVANLLLTRGSRRRREIAIRSALGAPVRRVLRQLLLENLLLFGAAGALGLLVIHVLTSLVRSGWALVPPPGAEMSVDGRVALFTLGVTLATGLTFGLLPALQASRPDLVAALKGLAPRLRFRFLGVRNLLVGAQVGGSLVLVLAALLLMRSVSTARSMDVGFEPEGIATLSLDLSHRDYGEDEGARFWADLLERTRALPGVDAVGLASWVPLEGGSTFQGGLEPEGYEPAPGERLQASLAVVTPGYLDLTGMRLLRGRDFAAEDGPGSPAAALVNESFVRRFWPEGDGLGRTIGLGDGTELRVVGVVRNVPYVDLVSEVGPHIWRPLAQAYDPDMVLHARTTGDPLGLLAPMRRLVAELDPGLPVIRADLMEHLSANAFLPHRVLSTVLGAAGVFTLALAMLGIYGVVAYSMSLRTREMGLRMALGAEPGGILALVLGEGLVLSLIGLVPGLLLAGAGARFLEAVLIDVPPLDPAAFGGGVGLLLLAVLGASLTPGLRASRIRPADSLRGE
ncbi:MAG: ABC transporter permease [Gemmatimonadota bacterium]|jgi:predicted permease